jgi:hypothetical protein
MPHGCGSLETLPGVVRSLLKDLDILWKIVIYPRSGFQYFSQGLTLWAVKKYVLLPTTYEDE